MDNSQELLGLVLNALAKKTRFLFKGERTLEQLFSLSLENLSDTYAGMQTDLAAQEGTGLLDTETAAAPLQELRDQMTLVKLVFDYKKAQADAANRAATAQSQRQLLDKIIAAKQTSDLKALPTEKLLEMRNNLK